MNRILSKESSIFVPTDHHSHRQRPAPLTLDNPAVILTEHMVVVFRLTRDRVFALHFFDLVALNAPDILHATLQTRDGSSLEITSDLVPAFIKSLIRQYWLAVPLLPKGLKWTVTPPPGTQASQRPLLWYSPKFQLQYNATCSYRYLHNSLDKPGQKFLYDDEVPVYYHAQLAYGNHSFDFGEIAPRTPRSRPDPGPILASLKHCKFCGVLSITDQACPDIFRDIAEFIIANQTVQILVVNEVSATVGDRLLSDALQASQCPIGFWDLSSNRITDIQMFTAGLRAYRYPLCGLVLNRMELNEDELEKLFDSLSNNQNLVILQELSIIGSKLSGKNCRACAAWLEALPRRHSPCLLRSIAVGPLSDPASVCLGLTHIPSLLELRIVDSDLNDCHQHIVSIVENSPTIQFFYFTRSRLFDMAFMPIVQAIASVQAARPKGIGLNLTGVLKKGKFNVFLDGCKLIKDILSDLTIDQAPITIQDFALLLNILENAPLFRRLSIGGIFHSKSKAIMAAVKAHGRLQKLDISRNKLNDAGLNAVAEFVRSSAVLQSIKIEGTSIKAVDSLKAFLSACAESTSLLEAPFPFNDANEFISRFLKSSSLVTSFAGLRADVMTRLAINRYVSPVPYTSPLMLRQDLVLSAHIQQVTDEMRRNYASSEFDAFSESALNEADRHWACSKHVGLDVPIGRVLAFELDRRVRPIREARAVLTAGGQITGRPAQRGNDSDDRVTEEVRMEPLGKAKGGRLWEVPPPSGRPSLEERPDGQITDLAFLEVWPVEESSEYSDGELSAVKTSRIPVDLLSPT
jgi:hypothetical protein